VARRLALAFGCEVIFDMPGEEGMLRRAATSAGVPTLVYEAGEPLKFQRKLIKRGLEGIRNVLGDLRMLEGERTSPAFQVVISDHRWLRAGKGGILDLRVQAGDIIEKGALVAVNTKPFGTEVGRLHAPHSGLVVGVTTVPMVLPGSAVCHLVSLGTRTPVLRKLLERQPLAFE
jgi:predicted deacylase